MEENNRFIQTLDVLLEMENIDLLRVYGVGLLNRRETKEISQNEIAQMNESLAEIVATISLSMDNTYVEDIDAQTELILDEISELVENGSNEEIVKALFRVREEQTDLTETTSWVAYG
jgi:hypothetical protein